MKSCPFVKAEGRVWVPTRSSWMGNWARHLWLEEYFEKGSLSIASKDSWLRLVEEYEVYLLSEDDNGEKFESVINDYDPDVALQKSASRIN